MLLLLPQPLLLFRIVLRKKKKGLKNHELHATGGKHADSRKKSPFLIYNSRYSNPTKDPGGHDLRIIFLEMGPQDMLDSNSKPPTRAKTRTYFVQ